MIPFAFDEASIEKISIHKVGNKQNEEALTLSQKMPVLNEEIKLVLTQYFLAGFHSEALYHFHHDENIEHNETYRHVSNVFKDPETLYQQSVHLASHLYSQSVHPKIKGGEFYVVLFSGIQFNGKMVNTIGLFKSEQKETYLDINQIPDGFDLDSREGINIHKLDKGCLIFDLAREEGYILSIVDQTNRGNEARYWKDDFLGTLIVNNEFQQTQQVLGIAKQYLTQQISEEFEVSKPDQIALMNRSVDYFKTHETFDRQEFEASVFIDEAVMDSFRKFDKNYREDLNLNPSTNFDISTEAVKKQTRIFKSVLKLDKNFHIYIHGNRELIEQGSDEKGRKYYKIYYEHES